MAYTTHVYQLVAAVWIDISIAEVQSRLVDLGYYDGRIDGEPCPEILGALAKFQLDHGLPVTGNADPDTARTLRESYCF